MKSRQQKRAEPDPSLTSTSHCKSAVCYDATKQKLLKQYQESREPVTLFKVTRKRSIQDPSENDIIVNRRSHIKKANNNDIRYEYDETPSSTEQHSITTEDVLSLQENQLTLVKGTLTLQRFHSTSSHERWLANPYAKSLYHHQQYWYNLPYTLGQCDTRSHQPPITDVCVKHYDSTKYLTTTPASRITIADDHYPLPTEE